MGARKAESYPIQILSLSAIKVDHALQSRVATSVEYQREFSEAMLRGDEFPPITVFLDDKGKYWLADGFHRYGARKIVARSHRKFEGIRAEVRPGSREDAMVFSAGANQKFSIPRTKDDLKKATWMLLDVPSWRANSANMIAKHVGASAATIQRYEAEYYSSKGIDFPTSRICINGKVMNSKFKPNGRPAIQQASNNTYRANIDGRPVYLGQSKVEAEANLDSLLESRESSKRCLDGASLVSLFSRRGLHFKSLLFNPKSAMLPGLVGCDCVVTWNSFEDPGSSVMAVGRALCSRQFAGTGLRCVVLCHPEQGVANVLELGRQLGIEFMTPDEFVASLKADDSPTP